MLLWRFGAGPTEAQRIYPPGMSFSVLLIYSNVFPWKGNLWFSVLKSCKLKMPTCNKVAVLRRHWFIKFQIDSHSELHCNFLLPDDPFHSSQKRQLNSHKTDYYFLGGKLNYSVTWFYNWMDKGHGVDLHNRVQQVLKWLFSAIMRVNFKEIPLWLPLKITNEFIQKKTTDMPYKQRRCLKSLDFAGVLWGTSDFHRRIIG